MNIATHGLGGPCYLPLGVAFAWQFFHNLAANLFATRCLLFNQAQFNIARCFLLLMCALTGCHGIADLGPLPVPSPPAVDPALVASMDPNARAAGLANGVLPNPLSVAISDREFFWNQLVDTVDDYFDIRTEQQIHLFGNVQTEGIIETVPITGATAFEPWRWDSTPGFERWHSTLQSVRRRAKVRVQPQGGTYLVAVIVEKALEDVDRPAQGTPGSAVPRHDGSLLRLQDQVGRQSKTLGWIPMGRDLALEQEILRELNARLFASP